MKINNDITNWTIDDINNLQKEEDDSLEFKSGHTETKELGNKISKAASAFSNTGGGLLIIGIDDRGNIDGISKTVGKQPIRDWIDKIIQIEPKIKYEIIILSLYENAAPEQTDKCIVTMQFERSPTAPHMAYDNKYYIRAGAHSVPASHYIVEAIRLHSFYSKPIISWRLIEHEKRNKVMQLKIFTINKSNALNVKISFPEPPNNLSQSMNNFLMVIPVINDEHPFIMDIDYYGMGDQLWRKIKFQVEFEDVEGHKYIENFEIDKQKVYPSIRLTNNNDGLSGVKKSIDKLAEILRKTPTN
jgi:hypothetical protein